MKRFVKIFTISAASLLLIVLLVIGVAVWWVFTPERLTPVVREQAGKYLSCDVRIGSVELTFFSTFPEFGLRLDDVVLLNRKEGARSDTLAGLKECVAIVDVMDYLQNDRVSINRFLLVDGQANLYVAPDGTTNFEIVPATGEKEEPAGGETSFSLQQLSLTGIEIRDLAFSYVDEKRHLRTAVQGVALQLVSEQDLIAMSGEADLSLRVDSVSFARTSDSLPMDVVLGGFEFKTKLSGVGRSLAADRVVLWFDSLAYADVSMRARTHDFAVEFDHLRMGPAFSAGFDLCFRTLSYEMEGDLAATLGETRLSFPEISLDTAWHVNAGWELADLWVAMGKDCYVDHRPLRVEWSAMADTAFSRIFLPEAVIGYAGQTLSLVADVAMPDSVTTRTDVSFSLASSRLEDLWSLVPVSVTRQFMDMRFQGVLDLAGSASVEQKGDDLAVCSFYVKSELADVDVAMGDHLKFRASTNAVESIYPVSGRNGVISTTIHADDLYFRMTDSTDIEATLADVDLGGFISDDVLRGSTAVPSVEGLFAASCVAATMDTMQVDVTGVKGKVVMAGGKVGALQCYDIEYANEGLAFRMGGELSARTGKLALSATVVDDPDQSDMLLRYDPKLRIDLRDASVEMASVDYPIEIPAIDFDFDLGNFQIHDSRVKIGNSDFRLQGDIARIREFLRHEDLLTARLDFTSEKTDVYQLMDLVDGFGVADTVSADSAATGMSAVAVSTAGEELPDTTASGPFMVPKGVSVVLNTNIKHALVGANDFTDLGGKVTVEDGVLVLEEMGFSNKAARMQLTAMYKSEFRDHLFVGANFHLLDIEIADLIRMIPDIDTIVPMLSSFDGKAEFHLAAETNLKENYDIKMSTLKATAAIEGKDLVLMDSETFSTISKYLFFNKKTKNKVDSISVEMAVNRRKATLYPFLISMDKYQAVVAGSHNITGNMGFNYNISITDWPLPGIHPGVDVTGDLDNLSFKPLAKGKYVNLYKPTKRNATQAQTLELKSMIRNSLKRTVRPQTPETGGLQESGNPTEEKIF